MYSPYTSDAKQEKSVSVWHFIDVIIYKEV